MAWNRPTSNTVDATSSSRPAGRGKMPRLRRGLLAGVIVVLGAGIAAWLLSNGEATSSLLQKKDRGLIKEVKPAVAPKTGPLTNGADMIVLPNGVITNKPKTIAEAIAMVRLKPGYHVYNSVDEVFTKTNYHQIGEYKSLGLKTTTEAQLALIAGIRRDRLIPPMPPLPDRAVGDFQKALDNVLAAKEDDSASDVKAKKTIEMMKEMMISYVEKGMTPAQALHEIEKDHNRTANLYQLYRGEYMKMVLQKNPDADNFFTRATQELKQKGAPTFDINGKYIEEN